MVDTQFGGHRYTEYTVFPADFQIHRIHKLDTQYRYRYISMIPVPLFHHICTTIYGPKLSWESDEDSDDSGDEIEADEAAGTVSEATLLRLMA